MYLHTRRVERLCLIYRKFPDISSGLIKRSLISLNYSNLESRAVRARVNPGRPRGSRGGTATGYSIKRASEPGLSFPPEAKNRGREEKRGEEEFSAAKHYVVLKMQQAAARGRRSLSNAATPNFLRTFRRRALHIFFGLLTDELQTHEASDCPGAPVCHGPAGDKKK